MKKKNPNTDVIHDGSDGGPIYLDTDLASIRRSKMAVGCRMAVPGLVEAVTLVKAWGIPSFDPEIPEVSCQVLTEDGHDVRLVGLLASSRVLIWDMKNETEGPSAYYEKVRHRWLTKAENPST